MTAVAFAGIALAWGTVALVGHTRTYGPAWLVLSADILHVTTAGTWLGGLVGLAVLMSRTTEVAAPSAAPSAARTVAGFSRSAAGLVALLGVGGILLGWRILRSWGALFGTTYGIALLTKVGIAAVVVTVAAHNRFKLVPRVSVADRESGGAAAWGMLRRTVRVEASLLVLILAVTGVLVTRSPVQDRAVAASAGSAGSPLVLEAALGTGRAVARLTPGSVGVNSLELSLLDGAGEPITPVSTPELTVRLPAASVGPLSRPLSRTGPGRYQAVADFPLPGTWTVQVSVRTSKYDNPVARFTLEIR
jgi:copper transport protein